MKTRLRFPAAAFFELSLLLLAPAWVSGQDTSASLEDQDAWNESLSRFQELAPRLVGSARIEPGDIVAIYAGTKLVPAMETLAIEVQKAGGFPLMMSIVPGSRAPTSRKCQTSIWESQLPLGKPSR